MFHVVRRLFTLIMLRFFVDEIQAKIPAAFERCFGVPFLFLGVNDLFTSSNDDANFTLLPADALLSSSLQYGIARLSLLDLDAQL